MHVTCGSIVWAGLFVGGEDGLDSGVDHGLLVPIDPTWAESTQVGRRVWILQVQPRAKKLWW